MKLLVWIMMLIPMFIGGCFHEADLGYPKKVFFDKEGGRQVLTGDSWIHPEIEAGSYTQRPYFTHADSTCVEYEWLHVTAVKNTNQLIITAAPNEGKKRKLKIRGTAALEYCEIMVYQN